MESTGKIRNESPYAIFALILALYLGADYFYVFRGLGLGQAGLTILILPGAFFLVLWPSSLPPFVFMVLLHIFQTVMIIPSGSNHLIISFFLAVGLTIAYVHVAFREKKLVVEPAQYFDTFAPLGRWLLIIMYFYGTLHKVNTDFLNPLSSCAVAFWGRYGFPDLISESIMIHYMIIYGTLVLEIVAMILLLTRRFRWWGIVIGVSFHGFLGFIPGGSFFAFSTLAIMLHSLFLPKASLERFVSGPVWQFLAPVIAFPLRRAALLLGLIVAIVLLPSALSWGLFLAAVLAFIATYAREYAEADLNRARLLLSPSALVNVVAILFFLNGASPYLGFKTGQTISMFSNLITEGGRSNHLILPNLRLFDHQSRIATVLKSDHPALGLWSRKGYTMVEFQVLDYLERAAGTSATFTVNGETFTHSPDNPLPAISRLPPRWYRNLVVFKPVVLESPRKCDNF